MSKYLEKWILAGSSSRTCAVSNPDKKRWHVRLSQYFKAYGNALDARGEGETLNEAAKAAIIHFNLLLWRQVLRRTKDVTDLGTFDNPIIKEMRAESIHEFKLFAFLREKETRQTIYKNEVLDL